MAPLLSTSPLFASPLRTHVRRALPHFFAIVLLVVGASAFAGDRSADTEGPRQTFMTLQDLLERSSSWNDPKYVRGWSSYCAKNPERGGCEVVLRRHGHRPVIGVLLAPDGVRGVRIAGVTPESPADRAGVKAGDRLVAINGARIEGDNPQSRVDNARRTLLQFKSKQTVRLEYERNDQSMSVSLKPKLDSRVMILANDGRILRPDANVVVRRDRNGRVDIEADGMGLDLLDDKTPIEQLPIDGQGNAVLVAGVSPTRSLLIDPDCNDGRDCSPLRLSEAFRWNGFNLAAIDPQLGRYFGATEGVLVISSSPLLPELQAGDVIRKIDGAVVATPRAVMDSLRGKPAESVVEFEVIRDRRTTNTRIKLPEALAVIPPMPDQYADPNGNRAPQQQQPKTGSRIRR
jgi:membrane-associated protease RseP (regulator of RpoE activity)